MSKLGASATRGEGVSSVLQGVKGSEMGDLESSTPKENDFHTEP